SQGGSTGSARRSSGGRIIACSPAVGATPRTATHPARRTPRSSVRRTPTRTSRPSTRRPPGPSTAGSACSPHAIWSPTGVGPSPPWTAEGGGGIRGRDGSAFADPPWYPLATDTVRHVGEPVAIVVAATAASARDAAEAVGVRYVERPSVIDAVPALAEG